MPDGQPGPVSGTGETTLNDLGEWELIRRLAAFAPAEQFNDDAAVLHIGMACPLVVNTDVLVEGIHFSDITTSAADVGWRAAAANLSDLAAMGCTDVVGLTVGLVTPGDTPWRWVEGVYGGLWQVLAEYGGDLLGGDCSAGAQRLLAITAIGRIGAGGVIRRSDGRPGDLLVSTGPHGLSRLGLALLQGEISPEAVEAGEPDTATPQLKQQAITAHRRPRPRLDAVRALISSRPPTQNWRVGGCDSSDGLAAAVAAIAACSGCSAQLDPSALPLPASMAHLPDARTWCLTGGEDFELVLALEPGWGMQLLTALPGSTRIGELVPGEAGLLSWSSGDPWSPGSDGTATPGYSHFSRG